MSSRLGSVICLVRWHSTEAMLLDTHLCRHGQIDELTRSKSTAAGPTGSEESTMMASYDASGESCTHRMPSVMCR